MHEIVVCNCRPQIPEICLTSEVSIAYRCLVILFCNLLMTHEYIALRFLSVYFAPAALLVTRKVSVFCRLVCLFLFSKLT